LTSDRKSWDYVILFTDMRYVFTYFFLIILLFLPFSTFAAPSDEFWNPFRDSKIDFTKEINLAFQKVSEVIKQVADQTVSIFCTPTPVIYGSNSGTYNPKNVGVKNAMGVVVAPISSNTSISGDSVPCGGRSGDPFWASDCSCVCSKGKTPNLVYEVSDRCPEDNSRICEDCRSITNSDNSYTKVSDCRDLDF